MLSIGSLFKRSCTADMLFTRDFSTKLFIAGLSYDTNETVLRGTFGQHGEIIEAKVICDHKSGKSKGYGFVRFTSEAEAGIARKEMNKLADGRSIHVNHAHKDQ